MMRFKRERYKGSMVIVGRHLQPEIEVMLQADLYFVLLHKDARLPSRSSGEAAGCDLYSYVEAVIAPKTRQCIATGVRMIIPAGYYGRIAPRSGLALRHEIDVGGGVVDSDYSGEVQVILINSGDSPFVVHAGDRIAQMVLEVCALRNVQEATSLEIAQFENRVKMHVSLRSSLGFGSSGR